ncbi:MULTISPECIES: spore coat associated protein CotJA [Anaerostipes]|uniref:spore coat associated protein CotJA n=1 Tax=Anaerostipes TaxID=207244 RepID=UPI000A42B9F5|nr:spore coat associated protein CotJA [Anaerostipes sp. 494a]
MEKYMGQNCSCQRERSMEPRCEYDTPIRNHGRWSHRHAGVDSMVVAMQYVPWQHWNQIYCPEEGLRYGTIFPELNKPFYGKGACRR